MPPSTPPPGLNYAPSPSPGQPPASARVLFAWIVIIASVCLLAGANWRQTRIQAATRASATGPVTMTMELMGRYVVGLHSFATTGGAPDSGAQAILPQLDAAAVSPADRLAVVAVAGEVDGKQAAEKRLDALAPTLPDKLTHEANSLRAIYAGKADSLQPARRTELASRLGWCGKLALSYGEEANSPQRSAVLAAARRTALTLAAGAIFCVLIGLAGFVVLIILTVRLADGKLRRHYQPIPQANPASLEAFAIYIGGFTLATLAWPLLPGPFQKSAIFRTCLMLVPTIVAIAWPAWRGSGSENWKYILGWHRGRGVFREAGFGLLGYLAGLPLIAVGLILTLLLTNLVGAHPSHPIQQMFGGGAATTALIYLLASVYAPLLEETMFRGAFFHWLRSRNGWMISALLTSFIFALIHPQGWTVVPALMSVAIVLAAIREWRATIVSSAMAHSLHNTILVTIMTFAMT